MSLLVDKILDPKFGVLAQGLQDKKNAEHDMRNVSRLLNGVPRFALNDKASRFVCALPASITPETAAAVKMPYGSFWVETPWDASAGQRNRFGILYVGAGTTNEGRVDPERALEGELDRGAVVVFVECGDTMMASNFAIDMSRAAEHSRTTDIGPILTMQKETLVALRAHFGGKAILPTRDSYDGDDGENERFADMMAIDFTNRMGMFLAAFALTLSSPKVYERHPSDLSRLNKARAKSNKTPLMEHTVINITMDPPGTKHVYTGPSGTGGKRRLHFVRFFTRIVNGKLQAVSPHVRGDPSLGSKPASYKVK